MLPGASNDDSVDLGNKKYGSKCCKPQSMSPECKFDVVALFFFFPLFCFVLIFRGGVAIQTQSSGKLSRCT